MGWRHEHLAGRRVFVCLYVCVHGGDLVTVAEVLRKHGISTLKPDTPAMPCPDCKHRVLCGECRARIQRFIWGNTKPRQGVLL